MRTPDDEAWLTAAAVRSMGRWVPNDVPDDAEVRITDTCTASGVRHHHIEVRVQELHGVSGHR